MRFGHGCVVKIECHERLNVGIDRCGGVDSVKRRQPVAHDVRNQGAHLVQLDHDPVQRGENLVPGGFDFVLEGLGAF
jgi:hypothetical protein